MRIGVQTNVLQDIYTPDQLFRTLREAGLDCVDFNINDYLPYQWVQTDRESPMFDGSLDDARAILRPFKEAAAAHGVGFYQAHAPFPTEAENPRMLKIIQRSLEACEYLNCPRLVVHPAFKGYAERKKLSAYDEWTTNIGFFSALIPAAKAAGVRVCLENMFSGYNDRKMQAVCADIGEAVRYIDALNDIAGYDCFGFCLDTGHAMLFAQDQKRAIETLGHRLIALHLNDNDGRDDQHLAPYMGAVDWDAVTSGLRSIGYNGALCFEIGGSYGRVDPELLPAVLRYTASAGELFLKRVRG